MKHIDSTFGRVVRITNSYPVPLGIFVRVVDAETGEVFTNIKRAIITLDANAVSSVALTYYRTDDKEETEQLSLKDPEVNLVARTSLLSITGNEILFSSGHKLVAHHGVIGLSPELKISGGYDAYFPDYGEEEQLSPKDLFELSSHMIAAWQRFQDKLLHEI